MWRCFEQLVISVRAGFDQSVLERLGQHPSSPDVRR